MRAAGLCCYLAATATLLPSLLFVGCGADDDSSASGNGSLVVLAASSLTDPLTRYADSFSVAEVKTSFGGSDELAAQIRQGARVDVFASADTEYPTQLHAEGLVEKPVVFAANALVVAVPESSEVSDLGDLAEPGLKLVIGDPGVPVGAYTRTLLTRLPRAERQAILANVRSEEPEVSSVVAKLEGGAADAGFVYVTDVRATNGLRAVPIPARLQPEIAYAAAVVAASDEKRAAREFLAGLTEGEGASHLRRSGFLPPP